MTLPFLKSRPTLLAFISPVLLKAQFLFGRSFFWVWGLFDLRTSQEFSQSASQKNPNFVDQGNGVSTSVLLLIMETMSLFLIRETVFLFLYF
jgi:hypothetical protein